MKLILVEDDPLILACTQEALVDAGFEVLPALTGPEALELLSDTPACLAMMLDVRLEGRLDGWEVARRARSAQPDIAIIYTTTAETSDYRQQAVDRSILVQKPYTLDRAVSAAVEACERVA
jgi:CheY-like chemotaxis protein